MNDECWFLLHHIYLAASSIYTLNVVVQSFINSGSVDDFKQKHILYMLIIHGHV